MSLAAASSPARWQVKLLRAIWFVAMPFVLTALVMRYLIVSPVRSPPGFFRDVAEWVSTHHAPSVVGFFLLFSCLIRYWRSRLPAAEQWVDEGEASKSASWGWLSFVAIAVVAALGLRGSLFQSYRVLSGSMLPTLNPGELVLSKQYAYGLRKPWGTPKSASMPARGDVVVFHHPPIRPDVPEELVKRVIGLPGDTISMNGGYAYINGWRVPTCEVSPYVYISGEGMLEAHLRMEFLEDRVYLTAHGPWRPDEGSQPYLVQPGEVFVLGDNRNNSSDSRAWNEGRGGGLRFEEIGGRVERALVGMHRDGSWDLSRFGERLGLSVSTEGIDDRDIRSGIEHCLSQKPKNTRPPKPGAERKAELTVR